MPPNRPTTGQNQAIGLIHVVVRSEELISRVNQYLNDIAPIGPEAISAAKALLR